MSTQNYISVAAMLCLMSAGCGNALEPKDGTAELHQADGCRPPGCLGDPNGKGIHIGIPDIGSSLFEARSLGGIAVPFNIDYFAKDVTGTYNAYGQAQVAGVWQPDNGPIDNAQYQGMTYQVTSIHTDGTNLQLVLLSPAGYLYLSGSSLTNLILNFHTSTGSYSLKFGTYHGESQGVNTYDLTYLTSSGGEVSYCQYPTTVAEPAVFYTGSYWAFANGARTDQSGATSLSCQSGAISVCMRWGYRPWQTGTYNGLPMPLGDYHAACLQMKRASYCGDSHAYTTDGTTIHINDNLSPHIQGSTTSFLEAYWGVNGAICVHAPRHPNLFDLNNQGQNTCGLTECPPPPAITGWKMASYN